MPKNILSIFSIQEAARGKTFLINTMRMKEGEKRGKLNIKLRFLLFAKNLPNFISSREEIFVCVILTLFDFSTQIDFFFCFNSKFIFLL